jgi:hypothetical protein
MPAAPPRHHAWPLLAVWVLTPLLIGPSVSDALDERSRAVQVTGSSIAWLSWAVALVAMLVPRTATLTAVRLIVPGAAALGCWAASGADDTAWAVVGAATGVAALLTLAAPGVSDGFVDGSSYGSERRIALRVPYALLLGPVPLAWAAVAAGVVTGPLLLAARQWLVGAAATAVGAVVVAVGVRQLHLLSRRWLVFVPAGVVVHDPLTLTEPILFQRHLVASFGPAPADTDALDVTGRALGLVLEIRAREPFSVGLRRGRDRTERDGVDALLVTPTRPATTLSIAADHRLAAIPPPTTRSPR